MKQSMRVQELASSVAAATLAGDVGQSGFIVQCSCNLCGRGVPTWGLEFSSLIGKKVGTLSQGPSCAFES